MQVCIPMRRLYSALLLSGISAGAVYAVQIRFNGFGDIVYGMQFGDVADKNAGNLYSTFGSDPNPLNTNQGFGLTGVDFVTTVDITDELTYQGEVNLQAARGLSDEIELDVERSYINYSITELFNVQAGLYFTPIGFQNRNLYARAWLMNTLQIHDFSEEELNLFPTHTVGINAHGLLTTASDWNISYRLSLGNGRASTPVAPIYARDPMLNPEIAGLIELVIPKGRAERIGISGWSNRIESKYLPNLGDVESETSEDMELQEVGVSPYATFMTDKFNVLLEYMAQWHLDEKGNLPKASYLTQALTTEVSLNLVENKLHPYVRYDVTDLPAEGGPYLGLRDNGGLVKVYVPNFEAVMVGFSLDVNPNNRLKLEYIHHLQGTRKAHGITAQTAFAF
jgi:hypothetical protein